ncbi:hypothetical protein GT037_009113 [Alternaria burnsii]|uniref:Uncharacterized protein n=1 Tax=Alternaria burnsii TaxID=1187904 RepID=A0A8H7B0E7_9PLEO|nr:uncharacterized protein GT037_009113 [Alternaria burnsii]KAF7672612.1 hypothetical protein GT037_009113 [Alternaria burnsii]
MPWALAIFGSILYGKGLVRADVNDTMMTSYGTHMCNRCEKSVTMHVEDVSKISRWFGWGWKGEENFFVVPWGI